MALSKVVPTSVGVDATYHRITTGVVDFVNGKTELRLCSYVSEEAARSGVQPLLWRQLTGDTIPVLSGDLRIWAYAQIKAIPEWADAKDV